MLGAPHKLDAYEGFFNVLTDCSRKIKAVNLEISLFHCSDWLGKPISDRSFRKIGWILKRFCYYLLLIKKGKACFLFLAWPSGLPKPTHPGIHPWVVW